MSGRNETLVAALGCEGRKYEKDTEILPEKILAVKEIWFEGKGFRLCRVHHFQSFISTPKITSEGNNGKLILLERNWA